MRISGMHVKDGPHTYATHCGWSSPTVIGLMAFGATRTWLGARYRSDSDHAVDVVWPRFRLRKPPVGLAEHYIFQV